MMSRISGVLLLVVTMTACEPRREDAVASRTPAQDEAARGLCIATELVRASDEEIDVIEAALPADIETNLQAQRTWQPQIAALQFAQVMYDHALLRRAAIAHVDSALNRARADSARHMETAARYTPVPPQPGSIEANVAQEYERRFARIRGDEDHRCNWDL
jgi:hypothetical protein